MKKVAVLGGGPAGSFAAERLARAGLDTVIFDEKLAWEKPCGGGLTYKAWNEYPFLLQNEAPKKLITQMKINVPKAGSASMKLDQPIVIYSRFDLNRMLLERAEHAGAQVEKTRVIALDRQHKGWRIQTKNGSMDADYCVVATGARNPFRGMGTEWAPGDTATALGYFVPSDQEHIDVQFVQGLEGYIWVFPRCGHLSVGICGKSQNAQVMRGWLDRYMDEHAISRKDARFYGHVIPLLDRRAWMNNRVAGDGWMAVGDAGGLVDPITGEGLYYAMRSGELASSVILNESHAPAQKAQAYRSWLYNDFGFDLAFAATLASRVYSGRFMFGSVPARMVQFTRRSPKFRSLMQDLFAGTQAYAGLRKRLLDNLHGTLAEVVMGIFLNRLIPEQNQA